MLNAEFLDNLDGYIAAKRYRLVNAVLAYENGALAFERYYNGFNPQSRNALKSVWKSILALTLGICVDRGLVRSVDDSICEYLPQFAKGTDPRHRRITVRHLLTMSSGIYFNGGVHYHCPTMAQLRFEDDWVSFIADVRMADAPGARFVYKEWDVILLSALIGKACGGCAFDVCDEYLFNPLGMESEPWPKTKCGVSCTVTFFEKDEDAELSARDTAKVGLLMLGGGVWDGKQIVSEKFIYESTRPSQANAGYGFLWWLTRNGFHGRGFGGQELNVYPAQSIVGVVQATATPSSKMYGDIFESAVDFFDKKNC